MGWADFLGGIDWGGMVKQAVPALIGAAISNNANQSAAQQIVQSQQLGAQQTAAANERAAQIVADANARSAQQIIDANEPEARGPYGGGVGQFGFNGDCTFALTLRSMFVSGEKAYTQTCGGIVYDSEPEKEYEEIRNKSAAMKKTLSVFEKKDV